MKNATSSHWFAPGKLLSETSLSVTSHLGSLAVPAYNRWPEGWMALWKWCSGNR